MSLPEAVPDATGEATPAPKLPGPRSVLGPVRFSVWAFLAVLVLDLSALAALGGVRALLGFKLGMRLDEAELLAVLAAAAIAAGAGWLASAMTRRVGFGELLLAALLSIGAGYGILALSFGTALAVFAAIPEGAIGFAPIFMGAGLLLCSGIGATVGHMLGAGSSLDTSFSYEIFIARAHLRLSRRLIVSIALLAFGIIPGAVAIYLHMRGQKRSPTLIMTVLSIGGVATGVMALCVVLSVMSGFELDLKHKILGTNAHAVVLKYGDFDDWQSVARTVHDTTGVKGVSPFVLNEVMVTSATNPAGVLLKGIDPGTVGQVTELPTEIQEGRLAFLDHPEGIPVTPQFDGAKDVDGTDLDKAFKDLDDKRKAQEGEQKEAPAALNQLPGIVIGRELARSLKVFVGDPVTVISPLGGELGPMGPQPKSMQFRVAGVFYSGMYEYDSKFAYIALAKAQQFFKMGDAITGLELKVTDIDDARRISRSVLSGLQGYPFRVKDWGEMNRNLFSALKLEKIVMAVILAFIVLVACFNILSTLVMLVLEKSKEISILKSMGSRDASVMKVFVLEGLAIGVIGTILGVLLGLLLCGIISVFPIPLDPEVYYIPRLPVRMDALQFALVGLTAVVLAYLATIFPALYASRLPPVEGLRND